MTAVIETLNVRSAPSVAEALEGVLAALSSQTRCPDETIVVLTDAREDDVAATTIAARHPVVRILRVERCNYFVMKNRGASAASSDVVAFIDSDAMPERAWLASLVAGIESGADVVAGRTLYAGESRVTRALTVADFSNTAGVREGEAAGFNLNNVAFRREVLVGRPLDERIPRDGGCYLLFHELRAHGATMRYESAAVARHALDPGLAFIRRHFNRGCDGVVVYRLDDHAVLRGSRMVQRTSLALIPLTARRIVMDWRRLVQLRSQTGVTLWSVPLHAFVAAALRTIELAGGLTAARRWRTSRRSARRLRSTTGAREL